MLGQWYIHSVRRYIDPPKLLHEGTMAKEIKHYSRRMCRHINYVTTTRHQEHFRGLVIVRLVRDNYIQVVRIRLNSQVRSLCHKAFLIFLPSSASS
jgi:hypothetical protein